MGGMFVPGTRMSKACSGDGACRPGEYFREPMRRAGAWGTLGNSVAPAEVE
jgi:hypothetical protein